MNKIKDLMSQAAKGAGIPDKISYKTGGLLLKHLISGRLLIPLVVMITNINHYKAFGKQLIYINGGLIPDSSLPFGVEVIDDINLENTEYPIGYILIALTSTFNSIKPFIFNQQIDEISLVWKTEIEKIAVGKNELDIQKYAHFPPIEQMKI